MDFYRTDRSDGELDGVRGPRPVALVPAARPLASGAVAGDGWPGGVDEWLTVPRVAEILALSKPAVHRLIGVGLLHAEKPANRWLIHRNDLAHLLVFHADELGAAWRHGTQPSRPDVHADTRAQLVASWRTGRRPQPPQPRRPPSDWLTLLETCDVLGVDEHEALHRVDRGELPAYWINGMFRFRRADVSGEPIR